MIKRLFFSALLAVSLGLSACAEIPAEAVEANQQVSVGIKTLQDNGLALISAWENTGYMVLDSKFDDVYARADKIYRTKKSIAAGTALTAEQQRDVAGLATLIRDEVRKKVAAQAAEFRQIVKENANTTLQANDSITRLLISANNLTGARSGLISKVQGLLPIPDTINNFISDVVNTIGDLTS